MTDSTYIQSEDLPQSSICRLKLEPLETLEQLSGFFKRVRYRASNDNNVIFLTVRLGEGIDSIIAERLFKQIGTEFFTSEEELTPQEMGLITNLEDLWIEFEADAP